ncbi:MAG TPA: sugar-binding protein [Vicinamibacterales bacterium]|nr:sugar-binding protein [Vicinamibacterales bacterium]
MKKLWMVIALVAMAAWACGGSSGTTDTARRLKFALIPKALDIPVFDYANIGAQRAAKDLGDVDVIYRGPDHSDVLKQKETLESFITQKVDGIAISVLNADALTATIDKAVDAGIPVVTWDSDAPASKRFAFWGVDDFKSGQEMGKAAAELLNGKGTVAFITSLGANNLARRLDGVKDVLKDYPDIKVIETYDVQEDSVRCSAMIAAGSNRYPDLGAWISVGGWPVFTQNALAPVPANTKVISFDTNPPAPDLIKAGKAQVLIGQKYFGWGSETMKLLHDAVKGKYPANKIIDSGVDVVTAKNVDDYIAKWKEMAGGGK